MVAPAEHPDAAPPSTEDVRGAIARATVREGRPQDVAVHETHISTVFVAGARAFKLKKPVVLPFVDYGTPQRRREMCRQEVDLNRRLAPDVYRGVRALAQREQALELADEEDRAAVDYVVEMRRFDERATLAAKLERGELTRGEVAALAGVLARFHERARRVEASGVPALAIERRMTENFHELLAIVDQRAEVERVLALERFAHAFVVAHAGLLDARARRGHVREGHGDLRAEHVLLEDAVEVIDCIEFNVDLRELDVADDLAFLVMDLVARGGERFARALVDAYREAGGDPGDDALIGFYAAYRALVRTKVALLRAAQRPPASAAHGRDSAAARDLLALAERFAWRARLPLAIVVCGLPASGKSHLAQRLAAISGLAHLSSDVTRKRLAGSALHERASAQTYGADFNRLTYAELGRRAAEQVGAHGGALIDATFRHRDDRDAFAGTFAGAAPLLYVECVAPPAVLARRAQRRDRDSAGISDASLEVVEREMASWEPLHEVAADAHVAIRTDRPVDDAVADLLGLLDERIGRLRHAPAKTR
ncbi:MAG TPA: AAA family ATPase [Solirubrobacteraceae bacterium]|nr:AAA family ATPase [Solirubrobacteraceae bacterium]